MPSRASAGQAKPARHQAMVASRDKAVNAAARAGRAMSASRAGRLGPATRRARMPAAGRPSLVDGAEVALRNWLAPGVYRPGDRLPPENEMAEMLGVSRGTLRTALRRLEETGEIVRRQGSGTFVGRLAIPTAFGERLERLEPYSSVARRRGMRLTAREVELSERGVEEDAAGALGLGPGTPAVTISRTLLAGGQPGAVMFDVVHPDVELPSPKRMKSLLEQGAMVLDVLIAIGVPVSFARTRVMPLLVTPRERNGRLLELSRTTALLELEELIFAGRDQVVAYSRDLFAPEAIDVMVVRSLDSPRPARVASSGARPTR